MKESYKNKEFDSDNAFVSDREDSTSSCRNPSVRRWKHMLLKITAHPYSSHM